MRSTSEGLPRPKPSGTPTNARAIRNLEVTLDDGTEVDVQLDKEFKVVGSEAEAADTDADQDENG